MIDIYKRLVRRDAPDRHYLRVSKLATAFWGLYAIAFAQFANHLGSLIEAVNIMGSLFYGTILGIFLVAFYLKWNRRERHLYRGDHRRADRAGLLLFHRRSRIFGSTSSAA